MSSVYLFVAPEMETTTVHPSLFQSRRALFCSPKHQTHTALLPSQRPPFLGLSGASIPSGGGTVACTVKPFFFRITIRPPVEIARGTPSKSPVVLFSPLAMYTGSVASGVFSRHHSFMDSELPHLPCVAGSWVALQMSPLLVFF